MNTDVLPKSRTRSWSGALAALLCLLFTPLTASADAERFAAEALQQNGRITLTPSFSPDGRTIYFAQSECSPIWECPQRLKRSTKGANGWNTPSLVPLPVDARVDWPYVSGDGNTLLFSWSADRPDYRNLDIYENFDLYTLDLRDAEAIPVPIAGADINRPRAGSVKKLRFVHNETLPSLTDAGDLYFMTERPDGTGERDIYVASATGNGGFETAVPLPAPINTPERDDGVWVDRSGTLMLLTYANRGGEGSGDIFVSRMTPDGWSQPRNLGPAINTEYAEFGARLTPDGKRILFTSDRPVGDAPAGLLQVWVADFPTGTE